MSHRFRVLILGASYGSLLATKLLLAGHSVRLVCLPPMAALINRKGTRVDIPVKGRDGLVEVDSRTLPGALSAGDCADAVPAEHDLVVLAMQEPQYSSPDIRALLGRVAEARVPCLSIMNMPPLPYLARVPSVRVDECRACYTDPGVWEGLSPELVTSCSPDPQAARVPEGPDNVIRVGLPTNFRVARFISERHTNMLRQLEAGIESARYDAADGPVELPVKLRVHESVFIPLSKWPMLIAGNYRCVLADGVRSICDAVHTDLGASRTVYEWVARVCAALGAGASDVVPFEKYAAAARSLTKPSSAARALAGGAAAIERVDRLVQTIAAQRDMRLDAVDELVDRVDARLAANADGEISFA